MELENIMDIKLSEEPEMKQDDLLNEIPLNMTIFNRRGKKNPLFLIHGKSGFFTYNKLLLEGLDKDQPIVFIEAVGLDGKKPPLDRVETIALHYFSSMVKIAPKGDWLIAANCASGLIATEICHLADQSGDRVSRLLLIDPMPTLFLTRQQRRLQKWKKRFVKRFFYRIPFLGTIAQKISQEPLLCSEDEEKKAFEASLDDRQKRQERREARFQDRISGEHSSMIPSEIAYNAKAMRCVQYILTKAFDNYTSSPWDGQTFVLQIKERAHMSEILKNSFPNAKIRIVSMHHWDLFSEAEGFSEIQKLFSDALSIDPEEKFL
jgi:thioesterase domain-containing protein